MATDGTMTDLLAVVVRAVDADAEPIEPAGAFLDEISVSGFRGIGPTATLPLRPGPGLTVVAGRNGSGKSSFCEALEVALTGESHRWTSKKSAQWQTAWRNLHSADAAIRVSLAEDGVGETTIACEWDADTAFADCRVSTQRKGEKRRDGRSDLGWDSALVTHRPILTYDELGEILTAAPSELHDALSTVLGLEAVGAAIARLDDRVRELGEPKRRLSAVKKSVLEALDTSDDERAEAARTLVRARSPKLSEIRALAAGTTEVPGSVLADLRSLGGCTVPGAEDVSTLVVRMRRAAEARDEARGPADAALQRRMAVITAALTLHQHHGDMPCPVCGEGVLDDTVAARIGDGIATDRAALDALNRANAEVAAAVEAARRLILPSLPATTLDGDIVGLRDAAAEAVTGWAARVGASEDPRTIADDLEHSFPSIARAVDAMAERARTSATEREDAWAPLATRLGEFAEAVEAAAVAADELTHHERAAKWLKAHDRDLKNERLRPIAEEAIEIWARLRQESNVEIAGLSLEGTKTSRKVTITSRVDGEEAPGMTVLSQGELHALALALFLPRATMADSPFRFVVLDDPVQAMDPSKVDGLLEVLSRIAERRQVIVFSHDDRLATAVRNGSVDATILEVSREAGSVVAVTRSVHPAQRYLLDAYAMTRDDDLPSDVRRRLLPGVLRMAVEAACRERWFARQLRGGSPRAVVEDEWDAALTTKIRISLAVSGQRDDLGTWHTRTAARRLAMTVVTSGTHKGLEGDAVEARLAVEAMVKDILRGAA